MVLTREYLSQYIYLESQLKRMRRRLKYFKSHPISSEHGVVSGSMHDFPFAQCHFVISGAKVKSDEERKNAVSQLIVELKGNERLYEDMRLDIEIEIEKIQDLEIKTIFQRKYIDRETDEQIGNDLGYDRSTICKKIDRYLEELCFSDVNPEISSSLH